MPSTRGRAVPGRGSDGSLNRAARRVFGLVGALALLVAGLVAGATTAPAGAAGTAVIAETFQNANVSSPSSWVTPPGPAGSTTNSACLTAGTATSQTPIPDCSASGGADGTGVLQLTTNATGQEGGALTSLSVPATNGLDATFDTYQYGGTGADGIGFVIAAEDPSNPAAPTQIGEPGGDLGYSADASSGGLADGYLGVGLDVFGNFSNPTVASGTGCPANPSWADEQTPGQVVVRGPGNGTAGYCPLDSSANGHANTSQNLEGSTLGGSSVPVEVVLNTTSATVNMTGTGFASDQVPSSSYGVAWTPIGGTAQFYAGPLPSTTNGGIPSGLYPTGWTNPTTGIPYQLGFGWVGSTGAATDFHQVSNVKVSTLQQVPVLSAAITDNLNGQIPVGGSVGYTLQAGVTNAGGDEGQPITMTGTFPTGVTPGTAVASGGWGCGTAGQVVKCAYDGPFPIPAGTTLPPVSVPATVDPSIAANTPLVSSVTVSSNDGDPATASDDGTASSPASLSSVTLSAAATSNPSAGSTSTPAGIGTVGLDNNGSLPTVDQQSSATGTSSTGLDGSPNAAVASTKVGAIKIGAIKVGAIKVGAIKIGAIKIGAIALGSQSQDVQSLSNDLLSNITVTYPDGCAGAACTDWQGILAGSQYAGFPLQSVSLEDVLKTTGSDSPDGSNPAARLNALPLSDIDVDGSPLGALPLAAFALGGTSIADIPLNSGDVGNQQQTLTDWCNDLSAVHWPCSDFGITSDTDTGDAGGVTVLSLGIAGVPLASLPLNTIPLGSATVDGSPVADLPLSGTNLNDTGLGTIKVGAIKIGAIKVGAIKVGAITLDEVKVGAIKMGAIPLDDIKVGAIPLGGLLLASIPNLSTVVDCSLMPGGACAAGTTLSDAATAGAILPSAVLSDVSALAATTSVDDIEGALLNGYTDDTTLADLIGAELADPGTTIGTLIDQIASADPSALNGLFLGDLLAGLVPESAFPWQDVNLATPGLGAASTGGGEVTLTATTTVANGPSALTEVLTVPAGFSLVPGSATFDGQPSPDPAVSGATLTANPGNSTGVDTYAVDVRPNEVLGNQPLSVTATLADGSSQAAGAAINITDPFAGNGSSTTPSTLQPDSLNVSFLSAPNVAAYWDINVPAGDSLSLDLSDLPADYDMVLYGPPTTELSSPPTQVTAGVTDTPPADQSASGQQDAPAPGTLPLLATLPVEAISSNRGQTPEAITTPALTGGTYLVQISGYNGAYSVAAPYALRSQLIQTAASPSCSVPATYNNDALTQNVATPGAGQPLAETWTASGGWSMQAPPSSVNTLFLVNPDRLDDAYGQSGANNILGQLTSTVSSGAGGMVGAIVPVEGNPQTAADYTAWDANPCSVQAANQVVSDIDATVRSLESADPTIANVVVVGADDQIPMGRVPDMTVSDNEADYAASTLPGVNDQLSSALSEGYFLSDDPYASPTTLGVGGATLYTPSVAIGRLVETPTQIDNALARFQSSNGVLNAKTALSTGYDFLTQGANAIAASLSGPLGAANVSKLISDSWTTSDLLNAVDGTSPANAPTVDSVNAHFDFGRILSANGDTTGDNSQILSTTDVRTADAGNEISQERLLFSLGCHSGLDIPTNEISNVAPGGVDSWASTFADEGAIWVGNTGYGYANDQYISYSAKLMGLLAQNLNGSLSIGDALSEAKQLYAAQTGVLDPYDMKADMESTFYGMPNYTLSGLSNPSTNSASATPQLTLGTDPATGLETSSVSLNQTIGTDPNQLGTVSPPEGGKYYEVNNSTLEQTSAGFPIEPLSSIDVTVPGTNGSLGSVAHGALITNLTSTDVGNFTPSIAEADSDTSGTENQISQYETSFPATLQRVATYQLFTPTGAPVTHQAVNFITGQFVPDPNAPGTGNQRLFTSLSSSVEYTPPSDTHFTPPTINEATGVVVSNANTADFNVVTTPAPGGSPVKEVLVLFTDTANPGTWTPVSLSQGATGAWTGGAPAPASGEISYIVQAVDGDGNVAMDSNKGVEFNQVQTSQIQGTGLGGLTATESPANGAGETEVDGFFNGPVQTTFTGAPGATVTYQVDGGPSQTVGLGLNGQGSFPLSGDGTHVITASDTGNQLSQVVQIDTTGPKISSSISAPHTGNGWTGAGTALTVSASDAGSGVASLTYQVGGGSPTPVTGPITPPPGVTTYNVTATDVVGNVSTASVQTQVDTAAPGGIMCTPSVAPTTWFRTDQSVTCTGTDTQSAISGGTSNTGSVTLSTSVTPGSTTSNASTAAGQLCDNVDNCAPIPSITGFMIDETPPAVSCPSADTSWHTGTVTFTCTVGDSGSGLANPAQANITLTASLPAGASSPSVSTNSVQVCDNVGNCSTAGPITNVKIDNVAPTVSCPSADTNWHTGTVSFTCTASDPASGLANPAQASVILAASIAAGTSNPSVSTNSVSVCDKAGNCATAGPIKNVKIDNAAPTVSCPSADTNWHTGTVSFTCTASDPASGLANPAQASVILSASIAAGTSNPSVSTNSVSVCDKAGNCATAGPIKNVKIDNTAPTISITNPTNNAVYTLGQPELAKYSCADTVSGISSCSAVTGTTTLSSGSTLPTSQIGSHSVTVTAKSKAGVTTTLSFTYVVTYKLCNFLGPVEPLGVAVVFSVTLCNYTGVNVGSSSVAITALNIDGTKALKAGSTFAWSSGLKVYAFAMLTTGLTKGTHMLNVSVTGDPVTHALNFTVK